MTLYSCESDLSSTMPPSKSKIWINSIIVENDDNITGNDIKVFLGNTSGINSGDKASYRDDALVEIKINSGLYQKLDYKSMNGASYRGYYYSERRQYANQGDTLYLKAEIPSEDFSSIESVTYIPIFPKFNDPVVSKKSIDGKFLIDVDFDLIDTLEGESYYEIKLQNIKYSDIDIVTGVDEITILNNLNISYGQTWNEKLNSILVDYQNLESTNIHLNFKIDNNHFMHDLGFELRKVTKDYYDYYRELSGGAVMKSNVKNGAGIFAGYSKYYKKFMIK